MSGRRHCLEYDYEDHYEDNLPRRIVRRIVEIATVIAFAWVCVYSFGIQTVNSGQSMYPVLEDGDRLLMDRVSLKLFGPQRFDIVMFHTEGGSGRSIKRVVGLPGETVQIQNSRIFIDGEEAEIPETVPAAAISIAGQAENPVSLGEGEYFVLSDNRDAGEDSRFESTGNITMSAMEGRIWLRISPLGSFGLIK